MFKYGIAEVSCWVIILLAVFAASTCFAEDPIYEKACLKYPKDKYMVGVGRAQGTGNLYGDQRVAEVMARLEIARRIRVTINQVIRDVICDDNRVFTDSEECMDEFLMVTEETVNETLSGSEIVDYGESDGVVFAIAVMPRGDAGTKLEGSIGDSIRKAGDGMSKGDHEDAKKEYKKAIVYAAEKEWIDGVTTNSSEALRRLENELTDRRERTR